MNIKRMIVSVLSISVAWMFLDWLVHGNILSGYYEQTSVIWRPLSEMKKLFWMNLLMTAIMAFLYTYLFEAFDNKNSNISIGLMIGLISGFSALCSYYYLPITMMVALVWAFHQVISGVAAYFLYRMLGF